MSATLTAEIDRFRQELLGRFPYRDDESPRNPRTAAWTGPVELMPDDLRHLQRRRHSTHHGMDDLEGPIHSFA